MAPVKSTAAASLTTIPTELLDEVASYLPHSSLLALALTSKKTNVSAIDTLYETYLNRTPPAKAPFYLFLRTICERPDLAAKVKKVDIRGWRSEHEVVKGAAWRGLVEDRASDRIERNGPSFSSTEQVVRGSSTERFKLFTKAAVRAGLITEPASLSVPALKSSVVWYTTLKEDCDFLRLLGRGVEDAQVVLMLALLPNMGRLYIDGLSPFPLLDWNHFLSRSSTSLRNLQDLLIRGSITTATEPVVVSTLQFLDITSELQKLQLENIAAAGHRFKANTLASRKLESLILDVSAVNGRLMRKMLDGQQLLCFTYFPGPAQVDAITGGRLETKDLITPLAASKKSLEKLMLFPMPSNEPSSLMMFEKLEWLVIPQPGVLNIPSDELDAGAIASHLHKKIPHTIEELHLRYLLYDDHTKTLLDQLAQLKIQGVFSALRRVILNFLASQLSGGYGSYVMGPQGLAAAGPIQQTWLPFADIRPQVCEEIGKAYVYAGIELVVRQSDNC
jgi:hypothetical protein